MLVLTVLTIIVVAFLQSMTVEQKTARSYANKYRAQLAANSALALAMDKILSSSTENSIAGLDQTVSEEAQPATIVQLDDQGKISSTSPISTGDQAAYPGKTHRFEITSTLKRDAKLYPIKLESGDLQSLAAFYVQPNTSKELLFRFPAPPIANVPTRAFSTTLQEAPLVTPDNNHYSQAQILEINSFAAAHPVTTPPDPNTPSWKDLTFTPATFNQFTKDTLNIDETWADTKNWSASKSRLGLKKINLRRLKAYLDTLSNSQAADNAKSKVVEALLENNTDLDPETLWGGGTFKWLIDPQNPDHYSLTEAKQILASLIDYLDADLHPTTDNVNNATYFGVEGRLESDGTVTGHPYIASLGGGLVFNLSGTGSGNLNSTRQLICWTLVNPWSHETLPFSGTYSAEITIDLQGTNSGGNLGSKASMYFGRTNSGALNERLTEFSVGKLAPNAGATFPADPGGLSFADFYSMLNEGKQQPSKMTFSGLSFKLTNARLKFTSTDGQTSYVQVIATTASPLTLPMKPDTITLPSVSSSQSKVYNPATVNGFVYLKTDPRLNFQPDSYTDGSAASTISGITPPRPASPPDITAKKDPDEWDGDQGMPTNSQWYASPNASKHFFNRSPQKLTDNPAAKPYDPLNGSGEVAVNSIGEIGYLFTGKPWQTLSLVANETASNRKDYTLLDFVDSGTMESATESNISPPITNINGKVNINTAPDYVLRTLFRDIPGITDSQIDTLVQSIITRRSTIGPFIGAGDFGELASFALGKTTKFEREEVLRRMANLTTTRSNEFTVYAYGEVYNNETRPAVANASLTAVVGLYYDASGVQRIKVIRKTWK